jgi:hypothetical protein
MGKTRRNRVVAVLGASGVLAAVLSGAATAAQAQPASALALTTPAACVAMEALVSDGVSGPGLGGEVLRVTPGGVSTLTTDSAPAGSPDLDYPSGMAFLPNGDIVVADDGRTNGAHPIVVQVNPHTGARTLISGDGTGSGPELADPYSVAVEASGDILVAAMDISTGNPELLRISPATGNRAIVTGDGVGSGPTLTIGVMVGLERGAIYLMDFAGTIVSVDAVTGDRTLVSGSFRGTGPALVAPVSMTSDSPDSVVVADRDHWSADTSKGRGALIRVDLATGNRTVLSDDATPSGGQQFDFPVAVKYNACDKAFYVMQTGLTSSKTPGKVLKVDAATGARTLFAKFQGADNYAMLLRPIPAG